MPGVTLDVMTADPGSVAERSSWPVTPSGARVSAVIALLDVLGILVAGPIALYALLFQRPLPLTIWLVLPVVPLIAAGQLCAVLALRSGPRRGFSDDRPPWLRNRSTGTDLRSAMLGALPRRARTWLLVALAAFWLIGITAVPWVVHGGPGASLPGCPYVLDDHGASTCVSHATYLRAGAGVQRFGAAAVTGFLLFHAGILWNVRARVRRSGAAKRPLRPR